MNINDISPDSYTVNYAAPAAQPSSFSQLQFGTSPSAQNPPSITQRLTAFGKTIAKPFAEVGVAAYNGVKGTEAGLSDYIGGESGQKQAADAAAQYGASRTIAGHTIPSAVPPSMTDPNASTKDIVKGFGQEAGTGAQIGGTIDAGSSLYDLGTGVVKGLVGTATKTAVEDATPQVAKTITQRVVGVAKGIGKGAIAGTAIGAGNAAANGDGFGDVVKGGVKGGIAGALTGGAFDAAGQAASSANEVLSKTDLTSSFKGLGKTFKGSSSEDLEGAVNDARAARQTGAQAAVDASGKISDKVSGYKSSLGQKFAQGAKDIEQSNPGKNLDLTNKQVTNLQNLKESRDFSLPESLDSQNSPIEKYIAENNIKGTMADQLRSQAGQDAQKTAASLTPTEAQDLITQLNKSTYKMGADGQLHIDEQRINTVKDIKAAASAAFGKDWDKLYSNYSTGITAVKKLDDITNLSGDASATDQQKALKAVLNLSKTPEGKIQLQNAVDEFKNISGIDLNDHISAIQQIEKLQETQDASESALAQKQKPFLKQHPYLNRDARRIATLPVSYAAYTAIRAIAKALKGH